MKTKDLTPEQIAARSDRVTQRTMELRADLIATYTALGWDFEHAQKAAERTYPRSWVRSLLGYAA